VPSLDLRFADNKSLVDAATGASLVTFTRASDGTYVDSAGVLQTAATDVPRFDHDPTTGESLGLLVEEQRTNSIRNNTMVGAVAGTPGTAPTNWQVTSLSNGLNREIVGTGSQSGIAYADIRYSGTTTAAASTVIQPEAGAQIVAATGQSWTASSWLSLAGGSASGLTFAQRVTGRTSIGGFLEFTDVSVLLTGTLTRYAASIALANVLTARVSSDIVFSYANGAAIDITLRIGLPQLEAGAFATSPIPTTTAAVTRSADVASITGSAFSSWYRADAGTMLAGFRTNGNQTSGVWYSSAGGTVNEAQRLFYNSAITNYVFSVRTSSAEQSSINNLGAISVGGFEKITTAYRVNDLAASRNGGSVSADLSANLPLAIDKLELGTTQSANYLNGTIGRLTYWPQRLSNASLQQLTQ
jgi:hypothetical protein